MKFEKEITVSVNVSKDELIRFLENNEYKKIDSYILEDIYFVKNDIDLNSKSLEILKACILVRNINDEKFYLTYKYKEYDNDENIINEGKTNLQITNKEDAISFLETIGYKNLIIINDNIDVYEKNGLQLCIQDVNDKYLFIEMEENDKFNTVEKMIEALENTQIDYDKNNYFVKKAKIIFEENYRYN